MAFSLALIILLGMGGDILLRKMKIPGLVGMLAVGVLCGPYIMNLISPGMMEASQDFRRIALIVILLRAGFELRRDALHRVGRAAVLMSTVPALFEIGGIMLVAPALLGMSYLEAAILGSILAAVSPAVVVPLMIDFMDRGRGSQKGIPTLILGASSLDDVFVIVLFTIFLGMYGGTQTSTLVMLSLIPVSVVLGILSGIIPGWLLYKLFTRFDWKPPKRTLVVLGVAILLTRMETALEHLIPVASLLGVMAIGFIILERSEPIAHIISQKLKKIWVFAELILFVLVGAQVNIHVAWDAGFAGILVISAGLVFRGLGVWLSLSGNGFTAREKWFCVVAYIPKATVQAAIGAVPLAAGVASGEVILAVAVLSIVLTAPLGAFGIILLGEKTLDHGRTSTYRFKKLREAAAIPRVGERVRSRQSDDVWKIIEEKEIWNFNRTDEAGGKGKDPVPIIRVRLWKENPENRPGTGQTRCVEITPESKTFDSDWEVLYDW
ncbi:MAG: sodium:proton antiporter [Pseudomonadota bacterium]